MDVRFPFSFSPSRNPSSPSLDEIQYTSHCYSEISEIASYICALHSSSGGVGEGKGVMKWAHSDCAQ